MRSFLLSSLSISIKEFRVSLTLTKANYHVHIKSQATLKYVLTSIYIFLGESGQCGLGRAKRARTCSRQDYNGKNPFFEQKLQLLTKQVDTKKLSMYSFS